MLKLADTLTVPLDLITQKTAILARTGAGKTNAAVVIAEGVLDAKQQIVVLDPKGDWWGLRSSADGKSAGYPVTVLGGEHGDVPLEPTAGPVVADLVVDQPVSVVLDVSEFSNAQRGRFVAAFADRLYRRKAQRPDPMLLILEEADEVCPQRVFGDQAEMVGAIERIVKRGRFKGIGTLMITQRSASLNKDILTQTEVLIVMQTTGPQDIKAIDGWIEHHQDQSKRAQLLAEVGTLKQGEAFLWSPSWLERFTRFRFRMRHTFDAGRTPKVGERRVAPKVLADVDLEALREKMAETIERAKADDPRELRKRIVELERAAKTKEKPEVERVEVPVISDAQISRLEHLKTELVDHLHVVHQFFVNELAPALARIGRSTATANGPASRPRLAGVGTTLPSAPKPVLRPASSSGERLPKGEATIMIAIAQHDSGCTREQLTVLTGYKRSSRDTYLQRLQERRAIERSGDVFVVTPTGESLLPTDFEPLPTGRDLLAHWLRELPEGERRVLEIVSGAYPDAVSRETISEKTGYARSSRDTYLQRLGARRLVGPVGRGEIRMSEELS